jgi:hypothetical protein
MTPRVKRPPFGDDQPADGSHRADGPGVESDQGHKEPDGVRSLRDLQEESGDEDDIDDIFRIDWRSASEAGVDLDRPDGHETLPARGRGPAGRSW